MGKLLFILGTYSFLIGCAHLNYPTTCELKEGRDVQITEEVQKGSCSPVTTIYGNIRHSDLKSAVKLAFNAARNHAARMGANTIVYEDTIYNKAYFDHTVSLQFLAYSCDKDQSKDSISIALSITEAKQAQKAADDALAASMLQSQMAAQAAAQAAAMQAAQAAAQAAAMQAAQAATMHHHMMHH